jgi:hypothetical protein
MPSAETSPNPASNKPATSRTLGRASVEAGLEPTIYDRFRFWCAQNSYEIPVEPAAHPAFREQLRQFVATDAGAFIAQRRARAQAAYGYTPQVGKLVPSAQVESQLGRLQAVFAGMNDPNDRFRAQREQARQYLKIAHDAQAMFPEITGVELLAAAFEEAGQDGAVVAALELQVAYGACVAELRHDW